MVVTQPEKSVVKGRGQCQQVLRGTNGRHWLWRDGLGPIVADNDPDTHVAFEVNLPWSWWTWATSS